MTISAMVQKGVGKGLGVFWCGCVRACVCEMVVLFNSLDGGFTSKPTSRVSQGRYLCARACVYKRKHIRAWLHAHAHICVCIWEVPKARLSRQPYTSTFCVKVWFLSQFSTNMRPSLHQTFYESWSQGGYMSLESEFNRWSSRSWLSLMVCRVAFSPQTSNRASILMPSVSMPSICVHVYLCVSLLYRGIFYCIIVVLCLLYLNL